jgi:glucose/arabinose dehydrogenase
MKISDISDMTADGMPAGMTIGPDGTFYVVVNRMPSPVLTQAVIFKGVATEAGELTWGVLAESEPYPLSATPFDHMFNGIVVSPDNQWLFVNSGSRTDHGEVEDNAGDFPDTREVALTARIFRIPTDAAGLIIPNDETAQNAQGLLYASGTRNAYDLQFGPNGDLFAVDNGPDADFPDELNWIREGKHYGFPWRFGSQDNPQQFADYDGSNDKRLSQDFVAVQLGTYRNDPGYPPAPGPFTDPIVNLGPAAAQYRGDDGKQYDAALEGKRLHTFTAHRSPLGLVFAADENMPADLRGNDQSLSAFILSWGAAGGTLSDSGQDLLHLALTKRDDNYESVTTQIARDFNNPIDAVMIDNRLYVLEYGADGALWELTFE